MWVYISLLVLVFGMLILQEIIFKPHNINDVLVIKKRNYIKNASFFLVFIILGVFSAIRDGIGIDYTAYIMHIEGIALGMPNYMEVGFKYLAKVIMKLTGDPKLVIGVAAIVTCYFYVAAIYKQSINIKMSMFLFITWGYYFFTFNTIRNYLALSIVFFAIPYVINRQHIRFIIWVIIATLFHKSAIICIPFYIIASKKINKKTYVFIILGAFLLLIFKDTMRNFIFWFYPYYKGTVYDSGRISIFNIIKSAVVLFYGSLYYSKIKSDIQLRTYFNLNFFALIIYTALYWLPEISRIGFYFNIVSILLIPNLTIKIKKDDQIVIKYMVYSFSIILFVLLMRGFYDPTVKLLPYKSWLF